MFRAANSARKEQYNTVAAIRASSGAGVVPSRKWLAIRTLAQNIPATCSWVQLTPAKRSTVPT